mmetsp:Transcript_134956/g.238736  ORF Transcript_134956/g.238736 Transcript_134956/m.238736 type:complete len:240 (+) Transcript_134956:131-850(+)
MPFSLRFHQKCPDRRRHPCLANTVRLQGAPLSQPLLALSSFLVLPPGWPRPQCGVAPPLQPLLLPRSQPLGWPPLLFALLRLHLALVPLPPLLPSASHLLQLGLELLPQLSIVHLPQLAILLPPLLPFASLPFQLGLGILPQPSLGPLPLPPLRPLPHNLPCLPLRVGGALLRLCTHAPDAASLPRISLRILFPPLLRKSSAQSTTRRRQTRIRVGAPLILPTSPLRFQTSSWVHLPGV